MGTQVQPLGWSDVTGWVGQGGAFLGIKRTLPDGKFPQIAARLKEHKIQALLVIGGFEVFILILFLCLFTFLNITTGYCFLLKLGLSNGAFFG